MKRILCDWEDLEAESRQLEARILHSEKAAIPFPMLTISNSPAVQKKAAEICVRDRYPAPANAAPIPRAAADAAKFASAIFPPTFASTPSAT